MMTRIVLGQSEANVTGTKPQRLRLGDWYCEPSTWAKAMELTAKAMLGSVNHRDQLLKTIHSINGIGAVSATLRRPVKLEANLWLEANKSAQDSLRTIVALLEAAEFPLEKASVEYESDSQQGKEETEASPPPKAENEAAALSPTLHLKEHKEKSAKGAVEKIGAYAKREIYAALAEGRVPDDEFEKLQTLEGTKELLGVSLNRCPMFSLTYYKRDGHNRFYADSATRDGKAVFVNSQWYEEYRQKLERMLARWGKRSERLDMTSFLDDIRQHWPDGFDFSDGAVRLLEGRCGKLPRGMAAKLKDAMFHLRGGLWIVPDAVAPKATAEEILREADRIVADAGFASLARLAKSPVLEQSLLSGKKERVAFVEFVLSTNGRKIIEHDGRKFAVPGNGAGNDDLRCWCGLVREAVEKSGAISYVELTDDQSFGNVDDDSTIALLREFEPDVIPELDSDGTLSFKMISEYFLPENFGTALGEIVKAADGEGATLTAAAICTALSARYGCDFAQDYALDPAYSLKWVVDAVWRKNAADEPHRWDGVGARARFVECDNPSCGGAETQGKAALIRCADDLPSQVEAAFHGVFSNEDFWRFSTESYGLASTREAKIAQLGHIAPRFVRLDRDHWISIRDFLESAKWNDGKAASTADVMREALGSAPMLPMASLNAATLDALPEIPYRWTPELAASTAALLCPGLHVANHGAAPFAMTTMLVPRPVPPPEVLPYVLGVYAARNPHERSVEGAFEFLKENNIRFRLTNGLRAQIEGCLAKEGEH